VIPLKDNIPADRSRWSRCGLVSATEYGCTHRAGVVSGLPAWETVLTSMFMHASILHIAGNMLFLWIFGNNVEESMGSLKFLAFYLVLALVFIILFFTVIELPALIVLGIWLAEQAVFGAVGLTNPTGGGGGVAYFAHVGGFVFGALTIRWLATRRKTVPPTRIMAAH
jgi:membrane associated rhomboid family serine protease